MATLFEKIRDGEIPSVKIYEDDVCFAILDINPVNKGHALVISKDPVPIFTEIDKGKLDQMIAVARRLDEKMRLSLKADGTNIIINNGPASGQEVPHLHIHVIPRFEKDGKTPIFSKEKYAEGEMDSMGDLLRL